MRIILSAVVLAALAGCGKPAVEPLDAALTAAPAATPAAEEGPAFDAEPAAVEAHEGAVTDLAFLDDGRLATVSYDDYRVALWTSDGTAIAEAKHDRRLLSVAALPDGSALLTSDAYGYLAWWPVTADGVGPAQRLNGGGDDEIEQRLGHHARLAVSPNGKLAATSSYDRILTVWDLKERKEIRRIRTEQPLRGIAFASDGRRLATGDVGNTWTLWDLASGTARSHAVSKVDPKSDLPGLAFSRDGARLSTGHMDSSVTLWDPAAGKELGNRFVQGSSVNDLAFDAGGTRLVVAAYNGNLQLWDVGEFRPVQLLKGMGDAAALCVAFSPGGGVLAAGTNKGRLLLFR